MQQQPDIKLHLRHIEYPQSAREALLRLEQLCLPLAHTRPPTSKQLDFIGEIIDEFVFYEIDRKGTKMKRLSPLQEIQLLEVLLDYFVAGQDEVVLNTVFMMLFTPPHTPSPSPSPGPVGVRQSNFVSMGSTIAGLTDRMRILAKLVSAAVALKNVAVLNCTGVWMQQLGCLSTHSLNLARVLVEDYFLLYNSVQGSPPPNCLDQLAQAAPHFTACFLTAASELYGGVGSNRGSFSLPPTSLLQMVVHWVSSSSRLCLTPLTLDLQPLLPKGSIVMTAVTPLAGLLRWCIESPLYIRASADSKNAVTSLYSQIHFSLLESMLERDGLQQKQLLLQAEVISPRHLTGLVKGLQESLTKAVEVSCVQFALDRLAQAIQVAQSSGCLYGNTNDLMQLLKTLPYNRLLDIVVRKNC